MIFLTVGTQKPFDRLVSAVDSWASESGEEVFAQIGGSSLRPEHLDWHRFINAQEFRQKSADADIIVAHAGMGTILTGLDLGKPVVVVPRLHALGEHRNDHQLATVDQLSRFPSIRPVYELEALGATLDALKNAPPPESEVAQASSGLLLTIQNFIQETPRELWPHPV